MKALQFERSVARVRGGPGGLGLAGRRRRPGRPAAAGRRRPARAAGPGLAGGAAPAGRDLRERPGNRGRPVVAVVRADRELPVRARPRGGRRRRRRPPGGHRAGPALPGPGHRPGLPGRARPGRTNHCERLVGGHLQPGLQTGYCADTGGGWSLALVAHDLQLHEVPDGWSDEAAVMIEPTACAVHGALAAPPRRPARSCWRWSSGPAPWAWPPSPPSRRLRPDIDRPDRGGQAPRAAPAGRPSWAPRPWSSRASCAGPCAGPPARGSSTAASSPAGAAVVFDCVGTAASLAEALAVTAPGGTVVLLGMPGHVGVDLTGLWQREVRLAGAYAYGPEPAAGGRHSFDLAMRAGRGRRPGAAGQRHLPPGPLRRRHRARRRRRPPRRRQGRVRPAVREAKIGSSSHAHAPPRFRPRRRPFHPAHPDLARRGVPSRTAPGRPVAGRSTPPSRSRRSTTPTRPSATPCCTRSATAAAAGAAVRRACG